MASTPHQSNDNVSTFSRESRFKEHLAEAEAEVEAEMRAEAEIMALASSSVDRPTLRASRTERIRRKLQKLRRKPVAPRAKPAADIDINIDIGPHRSDKHALPGKTRTERIASSRGSIRSAASSASRRVGASMRNTATAMSRKMHASAELTAATLRKIPGAQLVAKTFAAIADKLPGGDRLAKALGAVADRIPKIPHLPSWDKVKEWTRGVGTGFLGGLSPRRWTSPYKFAWR